MTDDQLIAAWRKASAETQSLWKELCVRGLGLKAVGIDPEKRSSFWRPPSPAVQVPKAKKGKTERARRYDVRNLADYD